MPGTLLYVPMVSQALSLHAQAVCRQAILDV